MISNRFNSVPVGALHGVPVLQRRKGCLISSTSFAFVSRAIIPLLLAIVISIPAFAQQTPHAKAVGQKLMCVCGCNQILTACNHVGCKYSHDMLKEVDDRVARNEPDDLTLQGFVQEYGPTVLAEPPASGFNWAAWVMPVIVPIMALVILWQVVRRWRHRAALAPAGGSPKMSAELLARVQRESEKEFHEQR